MKINEMDNQELSQVIRETVDMVRNTSSGEEIQKDLIKHLKHLLSVQAIRASSSEEIER